MRYLYKWVGWREEGGGERKEERSRREWLCSRAGETKGSGAGREEGGCREGGGRVQGRRREGAGREVTATKQLLCAVCSTTEYCIQISYNCAIYMHV